MKTLSLYAIPTSLRSSATRLELAVGKYSCVSAGRLQVLAAERETQSSQLWSVANSRAIV